MQPATTIAISRISPRWDRANGMLWLDVTTADGHRYNVGFKVGYYASLFCHYLQGEGVICQPEIGEDLQSVDGLFGFIKRVAKRASRAVKKVTRKVTRKLVRTASKAVRGVSRAAKKYGATALKVAASGASFVPGIGSGVAAGLAAAAAVAQGKSWKQIAREAALGALPGGPMARAALEAGVGVASGQRIDRALLKGVRKAIPGGAGGRAIFDASLAVARGKRVDRAVKSVAVRAAMRQLPPQARRAAAASIAAVRGRQVDRMVLGAARQIASAQMRGKRADRMFAAVGGRGLKALAAANRTSTFGVAARQASARIRVGRGSVNDRRVVHAYMSRARRIRSLARSRNPFARMAIAALKNQPGAR